MSTHINSNSNNINNLSHETEINFIKLPCSERLLEEIIKEKMANKKKQVSGAVAY
jgi:hypothetical protein